MTTSLQPRIILSLYFVASHQISQTDTSCHYHISVEMCEHITQAASSLKPPSTAQQVHR